MIAPNFLLGSFVIFSLYIIWKDFKTREANTFVGIAMLLLVAVMSTLSVTEMGMPLVQIFLQSLVIAIVLAAITISIAGMKPSPPIIFCTLSIFLLTLYTYAILLRTDNPIIPLMLFIPGLLLWSVIHNAKNHLKTIPGGNFIWLSVYMVFIFAAAGILSPYIDSQTVRIILALNFFIPVGMNIASTGYGEGDVLMIWIMTAVLLYLGYDLTTGYATLFYATILLFILYPIRSAYVFYKKKEYEFVKGFIHEYGILVIFLAILILVSFMLSQNYLLPLFLDEKTIVEIGVISLLLGAVYIVLKMMGAKNQQLKIKLQKYSFAIIFGLIGYIAFVMFPLTWFITYCIVVLALNYYSKKYPDNVTEKDSADTINQTAPESASNFETIASLTALTAILLTSNVIEYILEIPVIEHIVSIATMPILLAGSFAALGTLIHPLQKIIMLFFQLRNDTWQSQQLEFDQDEKTRTEPFSLELFIGLLIVLSIGTPADIVLKFMM